jgi:hypothetical protein
MTTSLVQTVTDSADIGELKKVTRGIIGERCWRAQLSYGDELMLHFGAKVPYTHSSMAGQFKGAWILGVRATAWTIDREQQVWVTSANDLTVIREKVQAIVNTTVTEFEPTEPDFELSVKFDNGYCLTLIPKAEEVSDLPHWELFFPDRRLVQVG